MINLAQKIFFRILQAKFIYEKETEHIAMTDPRRHINKRWMSFTSCSPHALLPSIRDELKNNQTSYPFSTPTPRWNWQLSPKLTKTEHITRNKHNQQMLTSNTLNRHKINGTKEKYLTSDWKSLDWWCFWEFWLNPRALKFEDHLLRLGSPTSLGSLLVSWAQFPVHRW